jgi:hypothetical protein
MIPDSQTDATTSLKSEILDSASTRVEISTPLDPGSYPNHSSYFLRSYRNRVYLNPSSERHTTTTGGPVVG